MDTWDANEEAYPYDGVQYDDFHGPRAAYRCVLCGETYPRSERLNSRNECTGCAVTS